MDSFTDVEKLIDEIKRDPAPQLVRDFAVLQIKHKLLFGALTGIGSGFHQGFEHPGKFETCERESCQDIIRTLTIARV